MLTRSEVDKQFRHHKQDIIDKIGRIETTDDELDRLGKSMFKNRWGGVHTGDTIILNKHIANKYFILNTGNQRSGGIHWVGMYAGTGNTLYVYDSFGRRSGQILRSLARQAQAKGYTITESNHDHEQRGYSALCGQISLAWLESVRQLGIRNALQI